MRRAAAFLTFASLIVLLAGCIGSRHRESPGQEWHPPSEMLEKYADKNGVVTRAAMEKGLRADFAAADRNHDGCLDADEARTVNEARWKEDASTASPLIDFRHNGCVDFDEFAATPRSLFDQLDKNGDGKLTPKELHPGSHTQF
ncbi:MAG TPA: hypothetical protein VMF67_09340 [Rhizomicrobium sp.]|nr:hypothetical protein [Rhizomicrobium sp.]